MLNTLKDYARKGLSVDQQLQQRQWLKHMYDGMASYEGWRKNGEKKISSQKAIHSHGTFL